MEKVRRNRALTTQRIVTALEEVIAERGLEEVGINRIAEKAEVSKVLIYRYFGGLEGLMTYYVKMGKLYPHFDPSILNQIRPAQDADMARFWAKQVIQTFRGFRASKAGREILKASVIENNELAEVISKAQDEEWTRLVQQLSLTEGTDFESISAILIGGMTHLTLLAQNNRTMVGINLRDEENWKRIERAIKSIYAGLNQLAIKSEQVRFELQTATPIAAVVEW
jgi:AcrR family transcriptional regulator